MDLTKSDEPVNTVAHLLTALILAVGAGIIAANAGWHDAPQWFQLLSLGVAAGIPALGVQIARVPARGAVYPVSKVDAFLTHAQAVEPSPAVLAPVLRPEPFVPSGPTPVAPEQLPNVDLDAVVKDAGLG